MAKELLQVRDLSVRYQNMRETVYAVNGISFTVNRGETLGIVGETGAGKTTTARSILNLFRNGVSRRVTGSIRYDGRELTSLSEQDMAQIRGNKIAMIFQDPMTSLNPVLTVEDQIGEVIQVHTQLGRAEVSDMVDRLLITVGLSPRRKAEYPHQMSGGMRQRVCIAMALACRPELLIADEPTTALDVTIQAQVLNLMEQLKQEYQMSMLLITHDLGVVAKMCDKVAVMYGGELLEYGPVEDIFRKDSNHPYTRGLFASLPAIGSGAGRLHPIEGQMPDPTHRTPGCSFAPRCAFCGDRCTKEKPGETYSGQHWIRCFESEQKHVSDGI